MRILKLTIYLLPMILALFIANQAFAATEFISVVDTDGTSGDYSSLSLWEQYNQVDLTATTTLVFSHGGITGTITDVDSVTGADSGATADVVHATDSQILLENIIGTFQSGEQVYETLDTNYVTISDAGDSAIAVASCRSSSGTADTTAVTIDGWTTSADNYIKIWTDPSLGNRHNGKWDGNKYVVEYTTTDGIRSLEPYTRIDGLQFDHTVTADGTAGVYLEHPTGCRISNSIFRGDGASNYTDKGISLGQNQSYTNLIIYNNIFYGVLYEAIYINSVNDSQTAYIYNNTISGCVFGLRVYWGTVTCTNNAIFNNTDDIYHSGGNVSPIVTYSAGDDDDFASGTGNIQWTGGATDWANVFTDYANGDFHLKNFTGTGSIINQGTDLSSEGFSDDIDGQTRDQNGNGWDIGADEAAEKIYRSVGPSAATALETGTSNSLTISGTTATFASALGDDVGVGDVIQYDSDDNGIIDSVCFIHGRTDSTHYTIKNSTGGTPTATSAADNDWSIYRAYTSLYNAESGNENDSLDDGLENFDTWSGGKDIEASNEQWNIACYNGEGGAADETAVDIDGWTTSADNYIKVYTPTEATEVGTSQRHSGVWDEGKYRLEISAVSNINAVIIKESYVRLEGIQIEQQGDEAGIVFSLPGNGIGHVTNSIIKNTYSESATDLEGIVAIEYASDAFSLYAINNIVYGFNQSSSARGIFAWGDGVTLYVYNNTVSDCYRGIAFGSGSVLTVKNSTVFNNTDDFYGTMTIDYCASDDVDGNHAVDLNENAGDEWTDNFVDYANGDFHLKSTAPDLIDAGTDLSSDSDLSFSDDIDGDSRPSPYWDIGADEYPATVKVEFKGITEFLGNIEVR